MKKAFLTTCIAITLATGTAVPGYAVTPSPHHGIESASPLHVSDFKCKIFKAFCR